MRDRLIALGTFVLGAFLICISLYRIPGIAQSLDPSSNFEDRNTVVETFTPQPETTPTASVATSSAELPIKRNRFVRDPIVGPGETSVRVPVLMYHYVRPFTPELSRSGILLSVTPEHFAQQMKDLSDSGYHTITPDELDAAINSNGQLPAKPVLVTFDDGYRGQYTYAFPVLRDLGLRATFFVMTTYKGYSGYLTTDMMKEMEASGVATIASHTRHHAMLTRVSATTEHDEIFDSKSDLESMLGHAVRYFAYPYGSYNDSVVKETKEAGYDMAFSTLLGSMHTTSSMMELRRIRVVDGEKLSPLLARYSEK